MLKGFGSWQWPLSYPLLSCGCLFRVSLALVTWALLPIGLERLLVVFFCYFGYNLWCNIARSMEDCQVQNTLFLSSRLKICTFLPSKKSALTLFLQEIFILYTYVWIATCCVPCWWRVFSLSLSLFYTFLFHCTGCRGNSFGKQPACQILIWSEFHHRQIWNRLSDGLQKIIPECTHWWSTQEHQAVY